MKTNRNNDNHKERMTEERQTPNKLNNYIQKDRNENKTNAIHKTNNG